MNRFATTRLGNLNRSWLSACKSNFLTISSLRTSSPLNSAATTTSSDFTSTLISILLPPVNM